MQVFNQSFSVHDILIRNSYIKKGQKYLRPDSESKIPSVQLCTQCNDGKERIYSHGGDILNDGYAHDAWDCYRFLELGETSPTPTVNAFNWNMDIQRHNQRIGAKEKAAQQPKVEFNIDDLLTAQESRNGTESKTKDDPEKPKIPFSMKSFSLSGQSEIMKTKMLADRYVLDRIAILGQATTIYAKPNTGKTLLVLWMLIESIKANRISGENVYYINADDDYKGLVYKTSLAEKHGFQMLAPGHNDFESVALQGYMRQMIDDGTASGTVIILDTLKKFTDLMDKKKGSAFMDRAREYISNGGTLIMLAHTNKNRDADGKAVFSGTSDVVDDCDCVYILDEVAKTNTTKQVLFENIKCRGDVANELAFSYSVEEGKHYQYRLESVEPADKNATAKAKEEKIAADARAKDQEVIDAITEAIEQGITQKTPLIVAAHDCSGISRRRLTTVLTRYKGTDFSKGDLWREEVGDKNAKNYHLLSAFESTKDDYSFFKNGE
jgi:archaellum biogenesis ATPase FlaH